MSTRGVSLCRQLQTLSRSKHHADSAGICLSMRTLLRVRKMTLWHAKARGRKIHPHPQNLKSPGYDSEDPFLRQMITVHWLVALAHSGKSGSLGFHLA